MESKYKEQCIKLLKEFNWKSPLTDKEYEIAWRDNMFDEDRVIETMCQLAKEVEKEFCNKLDITLKTNSLYTKFQVKELLQKQVKDAFNAGRTYLKDNGQIGKYHQDWLEEDMIWKYYSVEDYLNEVNHD
jgi:hypothetical protein